MAGFLHRSQVTLAARTPGQWQDLKRDWQRWSRGERVAAECLLAAIAVGAAYALSMLPLS